MLKIFFIKNKIISFLIPIFLFFTLRTCGEIGDLVSRWMPAETRDAGFRLSELNSFTAIDWNDPDLVSLAIPSVGEKCNLRAIGTPFRGVDIHLASDKRSNFTGFNSNQVKLAISTAGLIIWLAFYSNSVSDPFAIRAYLCIGAGFDFENSFKI